MIELNRIYNMNCLEGLKLLDNNCIDLVITSPPYDTMRNYLNEEFLNVGDTKEIIEQLYRILKPGGVVVWVVSDGTDETGETGTSFCQAMMFKEAGFRLHDTMIYIKNGGINSGSLKCYQQKFEYMFVFSKGIPKTINLIRDRKNKYVEDRIKRKRQKDGSFKEQHFKTEEYGVRYNYWIYDTGSGKSTKDKIAFKHPAIFPEALAKDHIKSWSNEGDIVLDIFMGSGTTAKMSILNNRNFIGFEKEEEYCNIANERIKQLI